ncbi:uncharacterized protein LOC131878176 [Tigriopus californicus]|uniref:uncharacterized protein LOC131878176 n=1 Tax=Tigriopus californicus TaxID=6832 RepID=UPI0027DA3F2B|nr:uncharacterized protein LOC131878176 [Tigriopus californicus]
MAKILENVLGAQVEASLPRRALRVFDGKLTEYRTFMRSFRFQIEKKSKSPEDRLQYLLQYTAGQAYELISPCIYMSPSDGFDKAKELLELEYGSKFGITNAYRKDLEEWPAMKEEPEKMKKFSILLSRSATAMTELGNETSLSDPDFLVKIVSKLPNSCQAKWRHKVMSIEQDLGQEVNFHDLANFIRTVAKKWNHPVLGLKPKGQEWPPPSASQTKSTRNLNLATSSSPIPAEPRTLGVECPFCGKQHDVDECSLALAMKVEERRDVLRGRCFGCLEYGHFVRACRQRRTCATCNKRHPTVLHQPWNARPDGLSNDIELKANVRGAQVRKGPEIAPSQSNIAVALVPVKIRGQNSRQDIVTYAALDPYSTETLIKDDLLGKLGVKGQPRKVSLTTMAQRNNQITVRVVHGLELSDLENNHTITLPSALAYKDLPVDRGNIPSRDQIQKWPHLSDLPLVWSTAQVGVLVGMNVPGALRPLEVVHGTDDQPYAIRTKLDGQYTAQ